MKRQSQMVWCGFALAALFVCGCSSDSDSSGSEPEPADDPSTVEPTDPMDDMQGSAGGAADDPAAVTLTTTGPVEGGMYGMMATTSFVPLDGNGHSYIEKEFFFEGEATAYAVEGEPTMDGKWNLVENTKAPFKSRLYVRRPADAADFNGTVVVEWLNVSGGLSAEPGFMYNHPMVLREGWAWVGVDAQIVGIEGGGIAALLGGGATAPAMSEDDSGVRMPAPLKQFDPERYGSLVHPGDNYSYDIFTQAARVVRGEGGIDVLAGLQPERMIAYGESQSAGRMTAYVNGVAPLAQVFDGYFIHSRGAAGSAIASDGEDLISMFLGGGIAHHIRDDLGVPVFQFQTETDVHGVLAFLPARQPDTDMLRTWEVAGTAHADKYLTDIAGEAAIPGAFMCDGANDGPQRFVITAALHGLDRWIAEGTPPAQGDVLMIEDGAPVLDEYGNTLGGVRSPDVDVPIAIQSGSPPAGGADSGGNAIGAVFCGIFGSTTPFSEAQLLELYPTHEDYVAKVEAAAAEAVEAGFLLRQEADAMIAEARAAEIP